MLDTTQTTPRDVLSTLKTRRTKFEDVIAKLEDEIAMVKAANSKLQQKIASQNLVLASVLVAVKRHPELIGNKTAMALIRDELGIGK